MKIIDEQEPFQDWEKEVECNGVGWRQGDKVPCGSKLIIDRDDLKLRKWFKYPDSEGVNYGFICPNCNCFTEIPTDELDKNLRKLAVEWRDNC